MENGIRGARGIAAAAMVCRPELRARSLIGLLLPIEEDHIKVNQYVGHCVVAAVREWERPSKIQEMKTFLGFVSYHRRLF